MCDKDWINPTADGWIRWEKDSSCHLDLDEELDNSQNRLHEVSTLCCNKITKSLHCISNEVCNFPYYDGIGDVSLFLDEFERDVLEEQQLQSLDIALSAAPTCWWGTHKDNIGD